MRRGLAPLALAASFSSGCAPAPPEPVIVTPALPDWSAADQRETQGELEACLDCDATEAAILDYVGLRDRIRAVEQPGSPD
jgi:hypothetical protein